MVEQHHHLEVHEFDESEQALRGNEGQRSRVCCSLGVTRVGPDLVTKGQHVDPTLTKNHDTDVRVEKKL